MSCNEVALVAVAVVEAVLLLLAVVVVVETVDVVVVSYLYTLFDSGVDGNVRGGGRGVGEHGRGGGGQGGPRRLGGGGGGRGGLHRGQGVVTRVVDAAAVTHHAAFLYSIKSQKLTPYSYL